MLYAVKANDDPRILRLLNQAGVRHFDCASLPESIRPGDHLEFGNIGAYSLSGRTNFNGHFSDRIVEIVSNREKPP